MPLVDAPRTKTYASNRPAECQIQSLTIQTGPLISCTLWTDLSEPRRLTSAIGQCGNVRLELCASSTSLLTTRFRESRVDSGSNGPVEECTVVPAVGVAGRGTDVILTKTTLAWTRSPTPPTPTPPRPYCTARATDRLHDQVNMSAANPTTPPTPKVLAFDVFGTIVDWYTSIAREAEHTIPGIDGGAFALEWRKGYPLAMAETMASGTFRPLDDLHMDILRRIAPPTLKDEELQHLNTAWHRLDAWPDSVEGLTRLKTKFIISTLSNGGIGLLTNMAKRAGLPWDVVLGAEVFQAYKPDHRTYHGLARVLGVQPNEVMMVATHHHDLDAAQDAGLQTAYIERFEEFGPNVAKDSARQARHPLHFEDLNALADYFEC